MNPSEKSDVSRRKKGFYYKGEPAPAGCGGRLRPAAGWWRTGGLRAWTTSTLHGPPSGSRPKPAAAWWFTGLSHPAADLWLAVGQELVRHLPSRKRYYSGHCLAAGSCRLLAVVPPLLRCLRLPAWLPSISTIFPTGEPITSPARAAHTHICGLDKTPPPLGYRGGRRLHGVGFC